MNFDTIGGRRFLVTCASLIAVNVLQWYGKLDLAGTAYTWVMGSIVAAFITGREWQRHTETKGAQQ